MAAAARHDGEFGDAPRRGDLLESDSYDEASVQLSMVSPSVYYIASGDTQRAAEEYIQHALGSTDSDSLRRLADIILIVASSLAIICCALLFSKDRTWAVITGTAALAMIATSFSVRHIRQAR